MVGRLLFVQKALPGTLSDKHKKIPEYREGDDSDEYNVVHKEVAVLLAHFQTGFCCC
jgi:hypothetical protein